MSPKWEYDPAGKLEVVDPYGLHRAMEQIMDATTIPPEYLIKLTAVDNASPVFQKTARDLKHYPHEVLEGEVVSVTYPDQKAITDGT